MEGYWIFPDGKERGWQAKYFFEIGDSQWQQLDESVTTALTKHSKLVSYTVCLPIDLPDARIEKQKSLRQKWDERVQKWQAVASANGIAVTFELWGEFELLRRLSLEQHAGRLWFWFQQTELSPSWFSNHIHEVIQAAGPRYCDSSGLSDTGGSQIMVPTGGSKDEPVEIGSAAEAASVYGRV